MYIVQWYLSFICISFHVVYYIRLGIWIFLYCVPNEIAMNKTSCMSKRSGRNLYGNLLNKMGQDFLDIQYDGMKM